MINKYKFLKVTLASQSPADPKTDDKPVKNIFPWIIVLYEVSIYLSMDAYLPAFPKIAQQFSIGTHLVQLTAIIWMLGALATQLIVGPLSERFGRRPLLLIGGCLYISSSICCAFAGYFWLFLIGRILQGMAMPTMYIPGYAAINEYYNTKQAIPILARMNAITLLAPALGPLFGSTLLMTLSWRWIFIVLTLWSSISIILLYYYMPETHPYNKRPDHINIANIIHQYKTVVTNSQFMIYSLITFIPIVGLIGWMISGPFIVIQLFHYSTIDFSIIQACIFLSFIIACKIVVKYAHNHYQLFIHIGQACLFIGALSACIVSWFLADSLLSTILCIMLITFGFGLSLPILSRLTLETSHVAMGVRVTIFSVIRVSSGCIGSLAITLFYNNSLFSISSIMLIFIIIAILLKFCLSPTFNYKVAN